MEIKTFVETTLLQIVEGVKAAQDKAQKFGGAVNFSTRLISGREPDIIEFDIAVTTSETGEDKAGAGIFVAGFGLGGQTKTSDATTNISRIKFKVPVHLPKTNKSTD